MDDLFEQVDPQDPDMLRCPSCGNIGSAQAMEEKQRTAIERFRKHQENPGPQDPEDILRDVLWALRQDARKNLGKSGGSRSKSNKEDKLKSTRLRKCLDDDSVASATRPKAIDALNVMLTIRKMGHVQSARLRKALLAYIDYLVECGRLPADFFNPGGDDGNPSSDDLR